MINCIMGLCLILLGILVAIDPELPSYALKMHVDLSPVKLPAVIAFVASGVAFFVWGMKSHPRAVQDVICPQCETPYLYGDLDGGLCPSCNVPTMDVREYYDRKNEGSQAKEENHHVG